MKTDLWISIENILKYMKQYISTANIYILIW